MCQSQSPNLSLPSFPPGNHKLVSYICDSTSVQGILEFLPPTQRLLPASNFYTYPKSTFQPFSSHPPPSPVSLPLPPPEPQTPSPLATSGYSPWPPSLGRNHGKDGFPASSTVPIGTPGTSLE